MIEIHDLTKEFAVRRALEGVEATVGAGEVCGLIGPNGAGKTTLLRILATVLRPTRGRVKIAGLDLRHDVLEVRRRIGYMPDNLATYEELRVDSFLEFFAHLYDLPRGDITRTIGDILSLVDLRPLRHAPIDTLSLGVRQRLSLGRVLLHNPEVLLLDEPVSGLDPRARVEMRALLRQLGTMGKAVLISSHVLTDLAGLCDRYLVLEEGKVVFSGTPEELAERVAGPPTVLVELSERRDEAVMFLQGQEFVASAQPLDGNGLEVVLSSPESTPADVGRVLFGAGYSISRLARREVDLEEAFLRLTRGVVS